MYIYLNKCKIHTPGHCMWLEESGKKILSVFFIENFLTKGDKSVPPTSPYMVNVLKFKFCTSHIILLNLLDK